ncbi:MAG TPA: hypothetical protein VI702_02390 [Nitrospiria bacterium]
MIPEEWQSVVDILLVPVSWIPSMQQDILSLFLGSVSGGLTAVLYLFLFFPALMWIGGVWCTQLSIYTLPFRSNRVRFFTAILMAWWDAARSVWHYWVGLIRIFVVIMGWIFTLARLFLKLTVESVRQVVMAPFTLTGKMAESYFQPGVPWVAFVMLVFWCLIEAVIFTYTLMPTVSEVMADIVAADASPYIGPVLFAFLLMLIMGSFACLQALFDSIKKREYKFIVQMVLVELFVMFFEVMFLYRELVDAITPWIAQQTAEGFRMGIVSTLALATFGWTGIRGMTWFLFGQYGTPPLLAFISRRPLHTEGMKASAGASVESPAWWQGPIQDFKREVDWLHARGNELLEHLSLPVLQVMAALLNFAMVLVASRPFFSLPFKNLGEVLETRALFSDPHPQPRKVEP